MGAIEVKRDWAWSDQFLPEVKAILGLHLISIAPLTLDRTEACDLMSPSARIAVRVRRATYRSYQKQFTLRSARESGGLAEFEKIVDGYGDYLFYGFESDRRDGRLGTWHLISLRALRAHLIRQEAIASGERRNSDGTSFRWFDLGSFQSSPAILVATNHPSLRKDAVA